MSAATLPPPRPAVCLTRTDLSRGIKGGTVIAEDVTTVGTHARRVADPDGYRGCVSPCRHCRSKALHAHCFRERKLRPACADDPVVTITIRIFRCADCRAVFTVLPAFVARHLWRAWKTVKAVVKFGVSAPRSTRRRWLARLKSDASQLVQVLAVSLGAVTSKLFQGHTTRECFVEVLAAVHEAGVTPFGFAAGWIHRLAAGIRIM